MKLRLLALAALATVGTAPAHAAASSSASFTSIAFSVVDLNPTDSETPWVTFTYDLLGGTASYANTTVSVTDPNTGTDSDPSNTVGVRSTTGKSATSSLGGATASASVVGSNAGYITITGPYTYDATTLSSVSTSGSATNGVDGGYTSYSANAGFPYGGWYNIELGANTGLIVSTTAAVSATTTVAYDSMLGQGESSSAYASMYAYGPAGSGYQSFSNSLSAYNDGQWDAGITNSSSSVFAASFLNTSTSAQSAQLNLTASVNGTSNIAPAPVPEPETYAMMLAGLGALGFIARRRKQQQQG